MTFSSLSKPSDMQFDERQNELSNFSVTVKLFVSDNNNTNHLISHYFVLMSSDCHSCHILKRRPEARIIYVNFGANCIHVSKSPPLRT